MSFLSFWPLKDSGRTWWILAAAGFLLSIATGMLIPVYTDETGWRFLERAAIDGFDTLFSDLCGPNSIARAPWHMMPVRWFSAITNGSLAAPIFVRGAGVACALAFAGLLWLLIRKVEPDTERQRLLGAGAFGLLGLGLLPFLMVLSRPEQPIILTTSLILLVGLHGSPDSTDSRMAALKIIAILALSIIAQSYHMKGVLYAGVAFTAMIACARGKATLAPRLIGAGALLVLAASSAHYWTDRLRCPGDAKLAAMYARENVVSALVGRSDLVDIAGTLVKGTNPLHYVVLTAPTVEPMSGWLPPNLFGPALSYAGLAVLCSVWALALCVTLITLVHCLVSRRWRAFEEPRFLLASTLIAVTSIWGASQLNRNVYEAAHVLPSLVLAMVLSLSLSTVPWPESVMRFRKFVRLVVMTALISQVVVLIKVVPPLVAAAGQGGYIEDQPNSVSIGDYRPIRRSIHAAMTNAGLPSDRRLNRLLVDELTYFALQDSRLPLHRLGVLSTWNGSIEDPVDYLRSRGSDGIVIGCHHLNHRLRAAASRSGAICAISGATLHQVERTKHRHH